MQNNQATGTNLHDCHASASDCPLTPNPLPMGEVGRRPGDGATQLSTRLLGMSENFSYLLRMFARRKVRPRTRRARLHCGLVLWVLCVTTGCRQDMHDQPKYESLEASSFFPDGRSSRPLV